jgi:hypothetical protein
MAASGNLDRVRSGSWFYFYRAGLIFASVFVALASACGDSGAPPAGGGDAGPSLRRLEIQVPPGDQLGLAFGESRELDVRYYDVDGQPMAGAEVRFALVVDSGSDPAGAVLSAGSALTDDAGLAVVTVTGGAVAASFRVRADADNATPVYFFVSVADEGFAALHAKIQHAGDRPDAHFVVVQARLYGGDQTCAALDPSAPPDSPFPTRTIVFGDEAVFPQLPANLPYTLLAWGTGAAGQLLASGCVELSGSQVPASALIELELPVVDAAERLAARYALVSTLDLGHVRDLLLADRVGWAVSTCPTGAAQLLLDCAIDALDGGDPLDCVVAQPGNTATALTNARGALDGGGCRAATLPGGGMSLDGRVAAALVASQADDRFTARAQLLVDLLAGLSLESTLDVAAASHRLDAAHVVVAGTPGADFRLDLGASARPLVVAHDVSIALGAGAAPPLALDTHGFTLRLGTLLADAFAHFPPQPSDGRYGRELVAGVSGPAGSTGCTALSAVACPAASLASTCLSAACTASVATLDGVLARPFVLPNGAGVDLVWSGAASATDADVDLIVESLASGSWSATLTLADGTSVPAGGMFVGQAAP